MKAIKKVLFVHADDRSLAPLFKAIFQRAVVTDPILSTADLQVDCAGIELPGTVMTEGTPPEYTLRSVLSSIGIKGFQHSSKNVRTHPELVRWADLILVPRSSEEDLLCLDFGEAWSKTIRMDCYCGKYKVDKRLSLSGGRTEDIYLSAAETFMATLPDLIDNVKSSYASAVIAKGISINRGIAVGNAFIAKRGRDLQGFDEGSILVVDRPGTFLFRDIDEAMAISIIKKFVESPVITDNEEVVINEFKASLKSLNKKKASNTWLGDGLSAFSALLPGAKALICSRGLHCGEHLAIHHNIPCVSSCVGATESIVTGQAIVVDAGRGEVYDTALLQN